MVNREWSSVGNNYLKALLAVAFQGFLIMVCVAIYAVLVGNIAAAANIHAAIWTVVGYTALLCFMLLKTGGLAKSIFSAHYATLTAEKKTLYAGYSAARNHMQEILTAQQNVHQLLDYRDAEQGRANDRAER